MESKPTKHDHSAGSFAHNNQDRLPSGPSRLQENTPNIRAQFDQARDPAIALQKADQNLTEAQRRESFANNRQKPQHNLKPPKAIALGPNAQSFRHQQASDHAQAMRQQPERKKEQGREAYQGMRVRITREEFVERRQRTTITTEQDRGR